MPNPFNCAQNPADALDDDGYRTRLHILADCNPAMIWIGGPDSQCVYLNKSWLTFTGRPLEQQLGNGWAESIHPEDIKGVLDAYLNAFGARRPLTQECRLRRADGAYRWIQSTAAPCYGDDGRFAGYIGTCVDVTDQRQALLEAEERFRLLVHSVKDYAMVTLDPDGRIMSWNEGAQRMTGYCAADAIGRECASFFRPEDRERRIPQQIFASVEREGHLEVEGWLMRKDGSFFLAMSSITALRDESGCLRGFGKVVRDITERRVLETELVRAKDELQMLVDLSPLAISLIDRDGHVMLWNPAAERLFGWRSEEILGMCLPIVPDEALPEFRALLANGLRGERHNGIELRRRRKDGSSVDVALWSTPYQDRQQIILGALHMYADIGERNLALARLKDANSRLHRLSERILEVQENERRHIARELHDEIGQALTAVKLKLEAMAQCCPGPDCRSPIKDSVAMCDDALARIKGLFHGLRPPQLDDLGLVAAVRWHLDQQAREAGFDAHFHADDLPRLAPELETAIFRVIQEALTNIVRHADARHVSVRLEVSGGELHVKVSDDGRGFDAGPVRTMLASGGCMGLSGMEERVTLSGGRFDVHSAPGKGTRIQATIPIVAGQQ